MRRIEWTPQARDAWQRIAQYIFDSFGTAAALEYEEKTNSLLITLASTPSVFAYEPLLANRQKPYRSTLIHRLTKVVYYVEDDVVYIAHVWDTRQEPVQQTANLK